MRPPLTTVRQPFAEMGRRAIEELLRVIEQMHTGYATHPVDPLEEAARIQLPASLIIRESCKVRSKVPVRRWSSTRKQDL